VPPAGSFIFFGSCRHLPCAWQVESSSPAYTHLCEISSPCPSSNPRRRSGPSTKDRNPSSEERPRFLVRSGTSSLSVSASSSGKNFLSFVTRSWSLAGLSLLVVAPFFSGIILQLTSYFLPSHDWSSASLRRSSSFSTSTSELKVISRVSTSSKWSSKAAQVPLLIGHRLHFLLTRRCAPPSRSCQHNSVCPTEWRFTKYPL